MVFYDYANEAGTEGLHDPNMEENNDELNHRQEIVNTWKQQEEENQPLLLMHLVNCQRRKASL